MVIHVEIVGEESGEKHNEKKRCLDGKCDVYQLLLPAERQIDQVNH